MTFFLLPFYQVIEKKKNNKEYKKVKTENNNVKTENNIKKPSVTDKRMEELYKELEKDPFFLSF